MRGGSLVDDPQSVRVSNRSKVKPSVRVINIGFRLCRGIALSVLSFESTRECGDPSPLRRRPTVGLE